MVATVSMERIEYYSRLLEQWRREDRETRERSRILFARARAQAEAYVAWARSEREMWEAWERSRLVNRLLRVAGRVCRFFVCKALDPVAGPICGIPAGLTEKRRARMACTAFTPVGPCPDTLGKAGVS